jgi:hypothetical protein
LLKSLSSFDVNYEKTRKNLVITMDWSDNKFSSVRKNLQSYEYIIDSRNGNLEGLKDFLIGKRAFLLRLLENPNLLEHQTFTDLLWAVFHLTEELDSRTDIKQLPVSDLKHLSGDIKRAYVLLISEWLSYMKHLKTDYPYLFSLAVRTNPFNPKASVEVK